MVLMTISLLPVRLILLTLKYSFTLLLSVAEKSSLVRENDMEDFKMGGIK